MNVLTPDLFHDSLEITYSLGTADNLGKPNNTKETFSKFKKRFYEPFVTPEKYRDYIKLSDLRKSDLKKINGWMMRAAIAQGQNRNRNSILPSLMMTLDMDYCSQDFVDALLAGKILKGTALLAHTTRSHTPEDPRYRIIILLKEPLDRDRYQAASRITAQIVDPNMEWVDKVSFRPAQMMFMPTCSSDMVKHYKYHEQPGELLDHEDVIEKWEMANGSTFDIGNLPRAKGEDELRDTSEKVEDALSKPGMVGDVCRSYSITELVEGKDGEPGLLAEYYEPVEYENGAISRMTYSGGTTSNGAVVYDDTYVYSHHGSDPAADKTRNAFDLLSELDSW